MAHAGGIVADVEVGRADLNTVLEKASPADIHYGAHLVHTTGARVETSRGRLLDADLLVVAEGTRSLLRARLFSAAKSRYLAFVTLPYPPDFGGDMRAYSAAGGVMVAIRPGRVQGQAMIAVRTPHRSELSTDTAATPFPHRAHRQSRYRG